MLRSLARTGGPSLTYEWVRRTGLRCPYQRWLFVTERALLPAPEREETNFPRPVLALRRAGARLAA